MTPDARKSSRLIGQVRQDVENDSDKHKRCGVKHEQERGAKANLIKEPREIHLQDKTYWSHADENQVREIPIR
jgi:hypothetical protein